MNEEERDDLGDKDKKIDQMNELITISTDLRNRGYKLLIIGDFNIHSQ